MTNPVDRDVSVSELECIAELLKIAMQQGKQWLKGLSTSDWRCLRYRQQRHRHFPAGHAAGISDMKIGRPPVAIAESEAQLKSVVMEGNVAAATNFNIVVRPDLPAESDGQKWICVLRVVHSENFDQIRHVNFHVWFHGVGNPNPDMDQIFGWRFENSEGKSTTHNLFHAQPLRGFHKSQTAAGFIAWMPESFPTIPVAAKTQLQLAFAALLTLGGKEALRASVKNATNEDLRKAAREYWGSIFAGEALSV